MKLKKHYFLILCGLLILFSCENKAQNNKESFCLNTNKNKNIQECEECLKIIDEMHSKNKINNQDFIIKKINYFLLLRNYDDAVNFINKTNFVFMQEKQIRIGEILLVKYFCSNQMAEFSNKKEELLSYIDKELLISKDEKLIKILKNEKFAIKSDLITDYYCSNSIRGKEEMIKSEEAK